jgi:hypothetical protein
MADMSVGTSEPKVPIGKRTVENSENEKQVNRATFFRAVVDSMVAELPGGDQSGDDAAEVVLRAALL